MKSISYNIILEYKLFITFLLFFIPFSMYAQLSSFENMHFGCDGNSITAGQQWSKYVVEELGFKTHHNVAVGSAKWACYPDTQNFEDDDFLGISNGWKETNDTKELRLRHNNVSKVHIQKFIYEVKSGKYPEPDVFVFAMGTNDTVLGSAEEALKSKDLNDIDITTMAGGARWSIQTMTETFPNCRVFLCTPIQSGSKEKNELNEKKIEILREICKAFSVQVIDCYSECGISYMYESWKSQGRYLKDGLHPDIEGQKLMGRYIAKEIRNNYY